MREVYDPKNPDPEFYVAPRPPKQHKPKRKKNIFATKWFMIGYGVFLTLTVISIMLYKNGTFKNKGFLSGFLKNKEVNIKINEIKYFDATSSVIIELENKSYTNSIIYNLNASVLLYSNAIILSSNYVAYNNINFPKNQRIGFATSFNNIDFSNANNIKINIIFDELYYYSKNIKIRKKNY